MHNFEACLSNIDVDIIKSFRLFNFGEPLLHEDVPGVISAIKRQKFKTKGIEIYTNAQHHDFEQLKEIFKTKQLRSMTVSCDGDGTAADYEGQRPPAKWERLLEFLAKASEFQKQYSPETELGTCTICQTPEGQQRWRAILDPLGIAPAFRGRWNMPDAQDFNPDMLRVIPNRPCVYLDTHRLYVNADGSVGTCCQHPQVLTLGNLKVQRYSEIFQGRPRRFLRELHKTDRRAHPICGVCIAETHTPKLIKVVNSLFGRKNGA